MSLHVNIGDAWKEVDGIFTNIGGIWQEADSIHCNVGGVWKEGWTNNVLLATFDGINDHAYEYPASTTMIDIEEIEIKVIVKSFPDDDKGYLFEKTYFDTYGATWRATKQNAIRCFVRDTGELCVSQYIRSNGDDSISTSINVPINLNTKYTIKIILNHTTKTLILYVNDILIDSVINSRTNNWSYMTKSRLFVGVKPYYAWNSEDLYTVQPDRFGNFELYKYVEKNNTTQDSIRYGISDLIFSESPII